MSLRGTPTLSASLESAATPTIWRRCPTANICRRSISTVSRSICATSCSSITEIDTSFKDAGRISPSPKRFTCSNRLSSAHRVHERIGVEHEPHSAQLQVEAFSERTGQRLWPARQVCLPPRLSCFRQRKDRWLSRQVFFWPESDGVHPCQLPQRRKAGDGFRRRLHDLHRRLS